MKTYGWYVSAFDISRNEEDITSLWQYGLLCELRPNTH